ncbi:partial Hercynine oxygenase, partial [Gammaproteobacteria bacterium]
KLSNDKDYPKWLERETPQHGVDLPAYAIGRYPVTNAEFKRFIDDGGYVTHEYWTDAGWRQKESENWKIPRFWNDTTWNDASQPVVGVSWYEAVAYCRWLSKKAGKAYRLPTEAEWEKAARGTDGRRYPWGNQWNKTKCNNIESGSAATMPVGQFSPQGDSPYGVGDMVGQVWEWCSTRYGGIEAQPQFLYPYRFDDEREDYDGDDTRVLRGGSWSSKPAAAYCRCTCYGKFEPEHRGNSKGFRCTRTL